MPQLLFISDLHLSAQTPVLNARFRTFLQERAKTADALYILGDLFDAWIGDDDPSPFAAEIKKQLAALSQHTPVSFLHGNRDFLIGEDFARETGLVLLPEEYVLQTESGSWLLLHGDQLCTDDTDYQRARQIFRSEAFRIQAMAMSIPQRLEKAAEIRHMSGEAIAIKSGDIMDVNQTAVEAALRRHGLQRMIHGHTHRPAMHAFHLDGQPALRAVLADWKDQQSFALSLDSATGELKNLSI
ncbi:UDP-2,3-diacylglucosamine diphosphatase [Thiolapillus sp.]